MKKIEISSLYDFSYGDKNFSKFFEGGTSFSKSLNQMIQNYNIRTTFKPLTCNLGENSIEFYSEDGSINIYKEYNNSGETELCFGTFKDDTKHQVKSFLLQTQKPEETNNFSLKYSTFTCDKKYGTTIEKGLEIINNEADAILTAKYQINNGNKMVEVMTQAKYQDDEVLETEELYSRDKNFLNLMQINGSDVFTIRQSLLESNKTQQSYMYNYLPIDQFQSTFINSNLIENMKQENIEYTINQQQE